MASPARYGRRANDRWATSNNAYGGGILSPPRARASPTVQEPGSGWNISREDRYKRTLDQHGSFVDPSKLHYQFFPSEAHRNPNNWQNHNRWSTSSNSYGIHYAVARSASEPPARNMASPANRGGVVEHGRRAGASPSPHPPAGEHAPSALGYRGGGGAQQASKHLDFDDYYQGQHAGKDVASGLGPGMVPNASAARGEAFADYYQGQHAGKDVASGLGPGMVPNASAARGEAFADYYQGQHAGKDVASGLGPGMVPNASAARGEAFADYYQGQHAGKDVASGLGPGMVPNASAARGEAFADYYQGQHAGKDVASGLGPGMVPNASAARGEAFADYYQGQHAGKDVASGLGPGMVPNASAARGEAFADYYQGQHAGKDVAESRRGS